MDSIVFYQPPQTATAFRNKAIRSSTYLGLPPIIPSRRGWQRTEWDRTLRANGKVELVDLTDPGSPKDHLLKRQAAGYDPARVKGNSTTVKDDCVRKGTDSACSDDDDEDLPSLADILSGKAPKAPVAKADLSPKRTTTEQLIDNGSLEGNLADAGAGAGVDASGVRPGDSQDKPMELDDDEPYSGRSLDATSTGDQPGSSLLSDLPSEIVVGSRGVDSAPTDGVNGDQNLTNGDGQGINNKNIDNTEQPRPAARQGYSQSSPHGKIAKEGSDYNSTGRRAQASAGNIYDVFAEYDKTFGKNRMGRDTQKLQQRSPSSHRSDSAPGRSITSDSAPTSSHSEASQKAHSPLGFDKPVQADNHRDTLPDDSPTVEEVERAQDALSKKGLQPYSANHSNTQSKRSRQPTKRRMLSPPSSNSRASKRSRSSAAATPSVSETDRSLSPPSKQADGNTGEVMAGSSLFTGLDFQDEEYPPSAFAGTVQDLGPPAIVPEDNQYSVECLLDSRVRRLGGRNRRTVIQYLVKWERYGNEHNSWVNETDIHEDLVKAYAALIVST